MLKFLELNDDKQPVTSFDTTYTSLDKLDNAGLLLNNKVVVVDFDAHNEEETKKIRDIVSYIYSKYPTFRVETTRGTHLYYKVPKNIKIKNWSPMITNMGINVDYKTGNTSLAVIKLKGIIRKTSKPITELKYKDLPELPVELYPLVKSKNNSLLLLKEGEGRNSILYNHLLNLRETYKLNIKEYAHLINQYIFDEELKEKELNTIVDSVLNKDISTVDYTNMIDFAKYLVNKLNIKRYQGQLYFMHDNRFINDTNTLLREISNIYPLKRNQDNEILHQLSKFSENINFSNQDEVYIRLNNACFMESVKDDNYDVLPLINEIFTPFNIDVNYEPSAYDENVDNFLNDITCNRKELRLFLEEIIGHILMINKFPHNIFFLTGSGKNGKSTFVTMLSNFAKGLTSHVSLQRFEDDTSIISLSGKLLNISDDVNASYIEKSEKLKLMCAGNEFDVRPNYRDNTSFVSTSTFILTANEMPIFKDKTNGFYRRVLTVPFDFVVKKRNANIDKLLSTANAKSYLFNLGLQGLKRIVKNGYEMTENEIVKSATEQYKLETDSIYAYLQDYPDIENKWFNNVYLAYEEYCEENYIESVPRNVFSRKLKNYGFHTGKQERVGETIINPKGKDRKILRN